jgi:hypothetical protein
MDMPKIQKLTQMSHDELIALIGELSTAYLDVCAEREMLRTHTQSLTVANEILRDQNSGHINTNRALSDKLYK